MNENMYREVLADMRAGIDVERMMESCGCMGCQDRVNGVCACEQAGYSPNGVRRPCKCSCQLPARIQQRTERRADNAAMIARAKAEIAGGAEAMTDTFDLSGESQITSPWTTLDSLGPLKRCPVQPQGSFEHCIVPVNIQPTIGVAVLADGTYLAADAMTLAMAKADGAKIILEPVGFIPTDLVTMERHGREVSMSYTAENGERVTVILPPQFEYDAELSNADFGDVLTSYNSSKVDDYSRGSNLPQHQQDQQDNNNESESTGGAVAPAVPPIR
jgi:hypothetical protein